MRKPLFSAVVGGLVVLTSACASNSDSVERGSLDTATGDSARDHRNGGAVDTRVTNASNQLHAFAGKTRTCGEPSDVSFHVTFVATVLSKPCSVEPLPGCDPLITEKPGRLRIVSATGTIGEQISGL